MPEPAPPDPRHYQEEVREEIEGEWDSIFAAMPFVPSLLPPAAQERAYRSRGGTAAGRLSTVATALVTLAGAVWFLTGRGPFNLATGLLLGFDGVRRLWRTLRGEYAPSLAGRLISDYLRPERLAYQAHLSAERRTLAEMAARSPTSP